MKRNLLLLLAMITVVTITSAQQWLLTGNSISSTDFLGSTNSQPLVFKVNNSPSGLIDHINKNTVLGYQGLLVNTTGGANTAIGYLTLSSNTSGSNNVAHGQISLVNNTTGSYNIALGSSSLWANSTGSQNIAIGFAALDHNSTADNNVACGYKVLFNNTTGTRNAGYGYQALYSNTTVSNLTAFGSNTLYSNTSGTLNTAMGYQSLYSNTSGIGNTSHGYEALYSNTTGNFNTAIGDSALYSNTTGYDNHAYGHIALRDNTTGHGNIAIGSRGLYKNTTGNTNTAIGFAALAENTTGAENVAIGQLALSANTTGLGNNALGFISLWRNTTGSFNSALGYFSLEHNETGIINTALGTSADVNAPNLDNTTMLGSGAMGTASNQARIGNSAVGSIGGFANWTNISDKRIKKNINTNVPGLDFINRLSPVTYNLDLKAADQIIQAPQKNEKSIQQSAVESAARTQKEQTLYTGFIAQEVESAAKSIGFDFSGVDAPKNDKDLYGLRYAEFVVPLVKAVQELSTQNEKLKEENKQMQSALATLVKRIETLELSKQQSSNNPSSQTELVNEAARLEQNSPNPFNSTTTVRYFIPENSGKAKVVISDFNGRIVKDMQVSNKGAGQIIISAGTLAIGSYTYTLFIDGQKVDSKQMLLTK